MVAVAVRFWPISVFSYNERVLLHRFWTAREAYLRLEFVPLTAHELVKVHRAQGGYRDQRGHTGSDK